MWALLIFRKLRECADAEGNAGQICSENNKKVSLVLRGLVRIKVVSWPGFPRKAEPEQRLPSGAVWRLMLESNDSHSVMPNSLRPRGLYNPCNSPGQNTGVGRLCLLQGIFPTQELNPGLMHCRQILYQLSHKWNPRILKWVAYPFFPIQGSNRGLLHCRQILYQLNYEGSPSESNSRGQSEQNREEYACKLATTMGLTLNPENSSEESFEVHLIGENEREEHLSISAHAHWSRVALGRWLSCLACSCVSECCVGCCDYLSCSIKEATRRYHVVPTWSWVILVPTTVADIRKKLRGLGGYMQECMTFTSQIYWFPLLNPSLWWWPATIPKRLLMTALLASWFQSHNWY